MAESGWSGNSTLDEYERQIYQLVAGWLDSYTAHLKTLSPARRPAKEFNDPVWGTISLTGLEVLVLDSPILQRLRRIRQLGVAHYVYTSANHTRIDHSIGVCHQIGSVATAVVEHAREVGADGDVAAFGKLIPTLRLAGLCHDIGHGLLSHVSENALSTNRRTNELANEFQTKHNKSKVQLSEMAAYFMLLSPSFGEMLRAAHAACMEAYDPQMPVRMAKLVAGIQVVNTIPLLHELLTGPFDADKMDYMKRDALMCGVPVVTDIERLVQKIRAVAKPRELLPEQLRKAITSKDDSFLVLGIARSGARALDELALGRSLMFDKIYRHHKVRAAEAMVGKIIDAVGPIIAANPETLALRINDDEFLDLPKEQLVGKTFDDVEVRPEEAAELLGRLKVRDIFVRSLAFASKSPFDEIADADERRLRNRQFVSKMRTSRGRAAFVSAVANALVEIAKISGRESELAQLPGKLDAYIAVDPPTSDTTDPERSEAYAYLIDEARKVIPISKSNADIRGWVDAYGNTRDIGYVFGPREIKDLLYVAAEFVLKRDHNVRMPSELTAWSKTDEGSIDAIKQELAKADFYQGPLRALGPVPPELMRGDLHDRLDRIRHDFQGYQGPFDVGSEQADGEVAQFDSRRVLDWVKQFPPGLEPLALQMVERVRMIRRSDVFHAVQDYMTTAGLTVASITPLGDAKDGSSIVAYYAGDLQSVPGMSVQVLRLDDALNLDDEIVVVDDFIGIGQQSTSILEKLLGETPTTALNETRFNELSDQKKQALLERPIHFAFVAGLDQGVTNLEKRLAELGFKAATVSVWLREDQIPKVADLSGESSYDEFIAELERIGAQLFADDENFDEKQPSLGYGATGALLITPFNTPTVTVSTLWKRGVVDGEDWNPLFPRRKKL